MRQRLVLPIAALAAIGLSCAVEVREAQAARKVELVLADPHATQPAMNDHGEIVYVRLGQVISTTRGVLPTDLALLVDAGNLGISNSGEVVYAGQAAAAPETSLVFSTTRGTLTTIKSYGPAISSTSGEVAYVGLPEGQPANVFTTLQGQVSFADGVRVTASVADVNDLGEVVYEYRTDAGMGLYSSTRGLITSGSDRRYAIEPAINNAGEIVWTGPDSAERPQIFSSTRGQLTFFGGEHSVSLAHLPDIDNNGVVVFHGVVNGVLGLHVMREVPDAVPPSTTAHVSPSPNAGGWHNSTVIVELVATDDPEGSGVKELTFSLSGAETGGQTVPGGSASVAISAEGVTTLTYFATDNDGNQEEPQSLTLRVDKTPPAISGMPVAGCTLWPPDHRLVQIAAVSATDTLSGLAAGSPAVTATSSEPEDGTGPGDGGPDVVIEGMVVSVRAERDGGGNGRVYSVSASATDLADNVATATGACVVPRSAP